MELIGGLVIAAIVLLAVGGGLWAKMHPTTGYAKPDETGVSEAEWMDAIR